MTKTLSFVFVIMSLTTVAEIYVISYAGTCRSNSRYVSFVVTECGYVIAIFFGVASCTIVLIVSYFFAGGSYGA